jgi:hypothetical protein
VEPTPGDALALEPTSAEPSGPLALPGTRQLISVGLDLCLKANASLRTASMAIGFQLLAAVGPLVVLLIVVAGRAPGVLELLLDPTGQATSPEVEAVTGPILTTGAVGALAVLALTIESRIVAVGLLGGQAIGRPIGPREALRRSRQVFWGVAAATFVIQLVVNLIVGLASGIVGDSEASFVLTTLLAALLGVPFVYLVSGIVLGAAPALEAIRRSVQMARTRWRLAIVVAIAEALAQTLLVLALLAGLDILVRLSDLLGLGLDSGQPTTFLTVVIALLATAAVGSLLFMVTALAASPQVVAFVGLTRYAAGLDRARDDAPAARQVRWLSIPMAIGIVLALLASLAGVAAAMQAA